MAKDDDLLAASGRPPPRRALASPGRKTAPAGTPVNKLPAEVAPAAVASTSSRPPSGSQNTMTPPRTVGGHTARLFRGEDPDDSDLEAPDVVELPRPRVPDRAARARAAAVAAVAGSGEGDDEETLARIAAKVKPPPAGARGGTMRMDASDRPPALGPHAVAAARRNPPPAPAAPPPLPVFDLDSVDEEEDVPSTSRGGAARDLRDLALAAPPLAPLVVPQLAPVPAPLPAAAPVLAPAAAPAPPIAAAPPPPRPPSTIGEISISGSEFEATGLPPQDSESRWPFAFAVGAVSLAIGSLLPLPFRQYIVRDRGPAPAASASASVVASAPAVPAPEAHPTAPVHTATPVLPSALAAVPSITPTASASAARPPAFGTVKIPRPNPSTPKDVF
ncbi:MAG: hypothetical protein ABJE95_06305 [Byssovorax sp.]